MAKLRGRRSVSYGRVSTNSEEQRTSIEAQKAYYADKFSSKGYEVANTGAICKANGQVLLTSNGIYADEGISGTSLKHRGAFNLMIEDAKAGKFDIIFVKSFSRYARNTVDGLKTCEELRDLGVGVYFEDYNICSISEDKDFELALFFSLAQKESQTKSYNVKWGLRQRQKSKLWRGTPPYGYYKDENGEFQIDPAKAKAVNLMVDMYLDGAGVSSIVGALRDGNYPTYGRGNWCATHIRNMLKQDLYNGNYYTHTMENKTIKDHSKKDYIPKEEQIHIELPHCKIIDDDRWSRVQAERERRTKLFVENGGYRERNTYLFSNLLYCECGNAYRPKIDNRPVKRGKDPVIYWRCGDQDKYGKSSTCPNVGKQGFHLKDTELREMVKAEILELKGNKEYLQKLFLIKEMIVTGLPLEEGELEKLQEEKKQIESNIKKILFRADDAGVSGSIYEDMLTELEQQLKDIKTRLDMQGRRESLIKSDKQAFDRYIEDLDNVDVENLSNSVLKRLFYKIHVVDMAKYSKALEKPQRGLWFDYYFLQMPYSELVDRAKEMGYPHMEELVLEVKAF